MKKAIIGILDYGAGNTTSVRSTINTLGFRSCLVRKTEDFKRLSLLLIPGVGAFPSAMTQLDQLNIVEDIKGFAQQGKGIIGVCLGMQLLADVSYEQGYTTGLGLIPGEVKPILKPQWHIGWNTLEIPHPHEFLSKSEGDSFYFNHSYEFKTATDYIAGITRLNDSVVTIVNKHNIYGFQFHPEKSQIDGLKLMNSTIKGLLDA